MRAARARAAWVCGVGGLGVLGEQQAGGDEVAGDAVGELLGQAAQLLGDVVVELFAGDVGVEVGSVVAGLFGGAFAVLAAGPGGRGAGPVPAPVRPRVPGRVALASGVVRRCGWAGRCGPRCGTSRTAGPRRVRATRRRGTGPPHPCRSRCRPWRSRCRAGPGAGAAFVAGAGSTLSPGPAERPEEERPEEGGGLAIGNTPCNDTERHSTRHGNDTVTTTRVATTWWWDRVAGVGPLLRKRGG